MKPLSESDVLDAMCSALAVDFEHDTLEEFLDQLMDAEVVMLHEAIHKHFGG
jgi:hypothetical protein